MGPRDLHVNLRPALRLSSPGLCKGEMPGLPACRHIPAVQKQDLEPGCACPALAPFIHAELPCADDALSGLENRDDILRVCIQVLRKERREFAQTVKCRLCV